MLIFEGVDCFYEISMRQMAINGQWQLHFRMLHSLSMIGGYHIDANVQIQIKLHLSALHI